MNDEINYKNNPLNGVGLKQMLTELTDHYGFEILFAYLNTNCFNNNPSVESSAKFLKKTDWAREKVEDFYLYTFKSLPKASYEDSQLSPRDRIIPDDHAVGEPAVLSHEEALQLRELREKKAADFNSKSGRGAAKNSEADQHRRRSSSPEKKNTHKDKGKSSTSSKRTASTDDNPWGLPRT